jgi:hypothetical protein
VHNSVHIRSLAICSEIALRTPHGDLAVMEKIGQRVKASELAAEDHFTDVDDTSRNSATAARLGRSSTVIVHTTRSNCHNGGTALATTTTGQPRRCRPEGCAIAITAPASSREKYCHNGGTALAHDHGAVSREGVRDRHRGPHRGSHEATSLQGKSSGGPWFASFEAGMDSCAFLALADARSTATTGHAFANGRYEHPPGTNGDIDTAFV